METRDLKQLFWDINETELASLEGKTVIARTLSHGTLAQIKDLFSLYGKDMIRAVFATLKEGALSQRRRDYFVLILS